MSNIFNDTFSGYHGETMTATVKGFTITARLEHDPDAGKPWKNCDAYGPVSDWTSRDKKPGERVLCSDRNSRRYYDWAEAIAIAKRDGWDAPPYGEGTAGQRAERAVQADFERLRAWCNDEWYYVAVVLSVSRNGIMLDRYAASLCGIESDSGEYLTEVANELADEALDVGRAKLKELCTVTDDNFEAVDE
jgi:hypothetical protein